MGIGFLISVGSSLLWIQTISRSLSTTRTLTDRAKNQSLSLEHLPDDILYKIFSHLGGEAEPGTLVDIVAEFRKDVISLASVSRRLNTYFRTQYLSKVELNRSPSYLFYPNVSGRQHTYPPHEYAARIQRLENAKSVRIVGNDAQIQSASKALSLISQPRRARIKELSLIVTDNSGASYLSNDLSPYQPLLEHWPSLRVFSVSNMVLTDEYLIQLFRATHRTLEDLSLCHPCTRCSMLNVSTLSSRTGESLRMLRKLKSVALSCFQCQRQSHWFALPGASRVLEPMLSGLAAVRSIKHLRLSGSLVRQDTLAAVLLSLEMLSTLELINCPFLSASVLVCLSKRIRKLHIALNGVAPVQIHGMPARADLPRLTSLHIAPDYVEDLGFLPEKLDSLRKLAIDGRRQTDEVVIDILLRAPAVERLTISSFSDISDATASVIAHMPRITAVHFRNTWVSLSGVELLHEGARLRTSFQVYCNWFPEGLNFSRISLAELREHLPDF